MTVAAIRSRFKLVLGGDLERIRREGYKARPDCPPVKIETRIQWLNKDTNVEFQLHSWRFLSAFWSGYLDTKDLGLLIEGVEIMNDWVLSSKINRSRYLWYDMAVGLRAMHIGFLLSCKKEFGLVFDGRIEDLLGSLYKSHKGHLENEKNITKGNHAIYQILGLFLMTQACGDRSSEGYCSRKIKNLIKSSFDDSSVCTENSPFYHKYNLDLLESVRSLFPLGVGGLIDKIRDEGRLLVKWFTSPEGEFYMIGDTEGQGKRLNEGDISSSERVGDDFVFKDLSGSGYQIVRTRPDSQRGAEVLVFYGPSKTLAHSHAHHLSFILFVDGLEIFSDPGKYTYEKNTLRDYFVGDLSHSTVGLKDKNFLPEDIRPGQCQIMPISFGNGTFCLEGVVNKGGIKHRRQIEYNPSKEILLRDSVEAANDACIQARYCLSALVEDVDIGKDEVRLFHAGKCVAKIELLPSPSEVIAIKGDGNVGWTSREYNKKYASFILNVNYPVGVNNFQSKIIIENALNRNVMFKKSGRRIKGFEEYIHNGCRFIFKRDSFAGFVVVGFSSIPEPGEDQKYKYLNALIDKGINFILFLDRDAPLPRNNGSYYLCPGCGFDYMALMKEVVDELFHEYLSEQFLLIGSSKGASSALLFGSRFGYSKFLVSAPQIRIAKYLENRDVSMLNEILGGERSELLDDLIVEQLGSCAARDLDVAVFIGRVDRYHVDDLRYLEAASPSINIRVLETAGGHGGESAVLYQQRLSMYLEASRRENRLLNFSCLEEEDLSVEILCADSIVTANVQVGQLNRVPVERREYAFYLMKGVEKEKTIPYSKASSVSFKLKEVGRDQYAIIGFLRDMLTKRVDYKKIVFSGIG